MSIEQKTALITGAGQGMGLGVAHHLAAQGVQVLINDIDPEKAEAAAQAIIAAGGKALAAPFDITKTDTVLAQVKQLEDEVGGIDILINNAGNAGNNAMGQLPFKDMPPEHWDMYIGINLYGVLNCTKAVIQGMCDRGWGRIITISSEAGRVGLDINVSIYGAAKAGAAHLMRHLAREVGPYGVTANVVSLGLMDNVPEEFAGPVIKTIPARRLGTTEDVAEAVGYLTSDGASWVTGQTLPVNGGSYAI
ncbi:MAG: SDR family oxidoreductase [Gammaproteobacteria bacterium]|nr:SDR family oxidoreductase [Gammaproteobacteria bacterium]